MLIDSYDLSALAAAKTMALCSPNRVAPRDLYDLSVLLTLEVEPPVDLLRRVGRERLLEMKEELWAKIDLMNWDLFRSEVAPHLPSGVAARIDESRWDEMRCQVGDRVEQWLQSALAEEEGSSGEEPTPSLS